MTEPDPSSDRFQRLVTPLWDDARARRVERALAAGLVRRRRRRAAGAALAGVALLCAAMLGWWRARSVDAPGPQAPRIAFTQPPVMAPWRMHAARGEWSRAWDLLKQTRPADDPEELLLAADVARLSRHPDAAVEPLKRLLGREPRGARAQAAAFTLGRVLDELRRPDEAARAFSHARAADPSGPLAGDALAREADAWSDANQPVRAARAATQYLMLHPDGNRMGSMKRHATESAR
jgi:predicted Zn-dependent protease